MAWTEIKQDDARLSEVSIILMSSDEVYAKKTIENLNKSIRRGCRIFVYDDPSFRIVLGFTPRFDAGNNWKISFGIPVGIYDPEPTYELAWQKVRVVMDEEKCFYFSTKERKIYSNSKLKQVFNFHSKAWEKTTIDDKGDFIIRHFFRDSTKKAQDATWL